MGQPAKGKRLTNARKVKSNDLMRRVWRDYNHPDSGSVADIAKKHGIGERTAWRYVALCREEFYAEAKEEIVSIRHEAAAKHTALRDKAMEKALAADSADEAAKWSVIAKDHARAEAKLLGLDAPARHMVSFEQLGSLPDAELNKELIAAGLTPLDGERNGA